MRKDENNFGAVFKILVGALAISVAGCASIQVDMDVYKGPFANHEDVEVEQFAVMAGAAKPILTKLQTLLIDEEIARYGQFKVRDGDTYRLSPNELYKHYDQKKRVLQAECKDYYDSDRCRQEVFVAGRGVRRDTRQPAFFVDQILALYEDQGFGAKVNRIAALESRFSEARIKLHFTDAIKNLYQINEELINTTLEVSQSNTSPSEKRYFYQTVPSVLSRSLRIRNLAVTAQVHFCGTQKSDAVNEFISSMLKSGLKPERWSCSETSSYNDWKSDAKLNRDEKAAFRAVMTARPVVTARALADLTSINLADAHNWRKGLIDKACANKNKNYPAGECALKKFLDSRRRFQSNAPNGGCSKVVENTPECPWRNGPQEYGPYYTTVARIQFIRDLELSDLFLVMDVLQNLPSAFGDTRLPEGIETLVQHYLHVSDECRRENKPGCNLTTERARERLSFALIHFAQKITYLADNEVLLANNAGPVDVDIRRHIRVLQAIGNTIMVLADDVRRLQDHNDPALVEIEAAAARRSLIRNAQTQMAALIRAMKERASDDTATLTRLDNAIKDLKKQARAHAAKVTGYSHGTDFELDAVRNRLNVFAGTKKNELSAYQFVVKAYAEKLEKDLVDARDDTETVTPAAFKDELVKMLAAYEKDEALKVALPTIKAYYASISDWDPEAKKYTEVWSAHKTRIANAASELAALIEIANRINVSALVGGDDNDLVTQKQNAEKARDRHQAAHEEFARIDKATADVKSAVGASDQVTFFKWLKNQINSPNASKAKVLSALAEYETGVTIEPPKRDLLLTRKDAKRTDVLDYLISELKYAHIDAVRNGGETGGEAQRLKAAIDAAYDYRGGLAYIRPSGTYLRSSFAAATLQRSSSIYEWNNMLTEQSRRAFVPFYRYLADFGDPNGKRDRQILAEIDKQFWQTINTVRVTGGGNTNYVIAKDDVGNFYVKGVATDPKDIVKSMKNLALFGLGASAGVNLMKRDKETDKLIITDDTTPMQAIYKKYEDRYIEATKTAVASITSTLTDEKEKSGANNGKYKSGLLRKLDSSWSGDADYDALVDALSGSATVLKEAGANLEKKRKEYNEANKKKKDSPLPVTLTSGQLVVDAIYDLRKFQQSLDAAFKAIKLTKGEQDATIDHKRYRLRDSAAGIMNAEIEGLLEGRMRVMDEFQAGVTVLGDISAEAVVSEPDVVDENDS